MTTSSNYCLSRDLSFTTTLNQLLILLITYNCSRFIFGWRHLFLTIMMMQSPSYNNSISWSQPWAYRKAYEADHKERYLLQTKWRNITSAPNSMYLTFSQLKMAFNSLIDSASCYKNYIYTILTKPSLLR